MPWYEETLVSIISKYAFSFEGTIMAAALACAAVGSLREFNSKSKALRKIDQAPVVNVSDLRSLLVLTQPSGHDENHSQSNHDQDCNQKVVIVRGQVDAKSVVDGKRLWNKNVLVSQNSGAKAVIVERAKTFIYNDPKGFLEWISDLRAIGGSWRKQGLASLKMVPFLLTEGCQWQISDYVMVNMDGSNHPLPLTTVYHHLQPIDRSPYNFLRALFGHRYLASLVDEERILPLGKDICAVGICTCKNGIPAIKSCEDLPYFLSFMTKDQMVADLSFMMEIMLWSAIIFGSLSIGIFGYALVRVWNRLKERRRLRKRRECARRVPWFDEDYEEGGVPYEQLCVVCLTRRKRSAFIPCGHLVCCRHCAIRVERESPPKCPLCQLPIRSSIVVLHS